MTILPELEEQLVQAAGDLGERPPAARTRVFGLGRAGGAIALVAGIGAVVAVVIVIASVGGRSQPAAPPAPGSAAAALDEAARAASAGAPAPKLRRGQVWYTEEVRVYVSPALGYAPRSRRFGRDVWTWESWTGAGGIASSVSISSGPGGAAGAPGFGHWSGWWIPANTLRTPASLLRALNGFSGYWPYSLPGEPNVNDTDTSPLTKLAKAAALLGEVPLQPSEQALVFRVIAQLPGLTYLGPARDPLGRSGVGVAAEGIPRAVDAKGPQRYRLELIFNPSAGKVLGFRTIAAKSIPAAHVRAGELMFAWAYERTGVISAAKLPSLVCATNAFSRARCYAIVRGLINQQPARRAPAASGPQPTGVPSVQGAIVARIKLTSPEHSPSQSGTAEILRDGKQYAVQMGYGGLSPDATRQRLRLWLIGGPHKPLLLGVVDPDGGPSLLPADAFSYRQLLVTLERNAHPSHPGQVILQGPLSR